jgi:hypothetical protein
MTKIEKQRARARNMEATLDLERLSKAPMGPFIVAEAAPIIMRNIPQPWYRRLWLWIKGWWER